MLKIDLDIIIRDFAPAIIGENWKKFLDRFEREAALFSYNISLANHETSKRLNKQIVVVVTNRNEAFWGLFDFTERWELEDLKFIGDHSSCWIDSIRSKLSETYFNMCKEIHPNKALKDVDYFITHNFHSSPIRKINTEIEIDRENPYLGYGYDKRLKNLKS